jgi:outer membrane protein assembly factor BamD (BamD/ComL family)
MFKTSTFLICILIVALCGCKDKQTETSAQNQAVSAASISLNNQGVGEMGLFNYDKATLTFEKLLKENPQWHIAQQNMAIALLNRQKPGDEESAIVLANTLIESNPQNWIAHYIIAILKFNGGLCGAALPHFEKIIDADPTDAYAMYFAGQCNLQNGQLQKAMNNYKRAISADGYLRSAYYGGFMAAQRLDNADLAKQMLNDYQKLEANPQARLAEIKYTRMGPKADAQVVHNNDEPAEPSMLTSQPPYFDSAKALQFENISFIDSMGLVNLTQSEQAQLYLVADDRLHIFNDFSGNAEELKNYSIVFNQGSKQLAWGDINNDSMLDLYVAGTPDQLYLGSENSFEKVDMLAYQIQGTSSTAVRLIDVDHDGDLDILLLSAQGQFEIWNNNLDNTFSALSESINLPQAAGYHGIYVDDIDRDRDVDIMLLADDRFTTLINDRMWDYQQLADKTFDKKLLSLSLSDSNLNGLSELSVLDVEGNMFRFEYDKSAKQLIKLDEISKIDSNHSVTQMLQIDINGNGTAEYITGHDKGVDILAVNGQLLEQLAIENIKQLKVINSKNGPELLVLHEDQLSYLPASGNRLPFLSLLFSGKEEKAQSMRSNHSGIGTQFIVYNGDFYASANTYYNLTGQDQDYQAISVAAGQKERIDFIAIEWSDGVYQTELALKNKQHYRLSETQRQLSSCPVIFAWNQGEYQFVSDVLGVGGIGFALGRNEYAQPRPWENYLLNSEQFSAHNGVFKLQFTEPMEESAYLDQLTIQVMDVPQQWSVILDERMQVSAPEVTGQALFYQALIKPHRVFNKQQQESTESALYTDKRAVEFVNDDHRFLGLVDEQIITLEFSEALIGDYQMILNGWVEYGYSQTMFAAWQAGISAQAPTIEYESEGQWLPLLKEFGYPAGMPRSASVPINIPTETYSLRIRTNMEIYFDQLALIQTAIPDAVKRYQLPLQKAYLYQLGFPKRSDNSQRVPDYQFSETQPFWDSRYMQGAYTRLGDVSELLHANDNAVAIIAAGEAIELSYKDVLPRLAKGYDRYYMLQFKGWAKDMDLLTKDGDTLMPIPANGKVSKKARALNEKYNTRFKAGR